MQLIVTTYWDKEIEMYIRIKRQKQTDVWIRVKIFLFIKFGQCHVK